MLPQPCPKMTRYVADCFRNDVVHCNQTYTRYALHLTPCSTSNLFLQRSPTTFETLSSPSCNGARGKSYPRCYHRRGDCKHYNTLTSRRHSSQAQRMYSLLIPPRLAPITEPDHQSRTSCPQSNRLHGKSNLTQTHPNQTQLEPPLSSAATVWEHTLPTLPLSPHHE